MPRTALDEAGNTIVAAGTPEQVAANEKSVTGRYIKPLLKKKKAA